VIKFLDVMRTGRTRWSGRDWVVHWSMAAGARRQYFCSLWRMFNSTEC